MTSSTPSSKRDRYRPYLAGCTILMTVGLLTTACWPAGAQRRAQPATVTHANPPAPPPQEQAPQPKPVEQPQPKPAEKPAQPLPERPAGDPSLLVVHGDRSCKQIAFTYDAGSGADGAAAILDVLKKHSIKATFFLTGKWVETYPALAKRIAAEGHEIANHTYSHPDLTKMTPADAIKEIKDGEAAIRKVTGKETKPLFREPYGAFSDDERRAVRQAGFSYSIYWDVDTLDWQFPPLESLVKKLTEKTQNGSIVLMHLNAPDSAKSSDQAIPMLEAKGYKIVTVTQVMKCQ